MTEQGNQTSEVALDERVAAEWWLLVHEGVVTRERANQALIRLGLPVLPPPVTYKVGVMEMCQRWASFDVMVVPKPGADEKAMEALAADTAYKRAARREVRFGDLDILDWDVMDVEVREAEPTS